MIKIESSALHVKCLWKAAFISSPEPSVAVVLSHRLHFILSRISNIQRQGERLTRLFPFVVTVWKRRRFVDKSFLVLDVASSVRVWNESSSLIKWQLRPMKRGIFERHSDIPRCSANLHPPWIPKSALAVETQQFLKSCLSMLVDCLWWHHHLEDSDHRDSGDGCWRSRSEAGSRERAPGLRGAPQPWRRKRSLREARAGDLLC